jgi:hypothetical protein
MEAADYDNDLKNPCTQFVHSAVSLLPSLIARLIFLAGLGEPDAGGSNDRIIEALLGLRLGKAEAGSAKRLEQVIGTRCGGPELARALRNEHLDIFEDWLCLKLRQQTAELERYAASQDIPPPILFRQWVDEKSYERLIPSGAMPAQRRLFLTDMETVLATLVMRTPLE